METSATTLAAEPLVRSLAEVSTERRGHFSRGRVAEPTYIRPAELQKNLLVSRPPSRYPSIIMMISLANQKGGVGKSTVAVHLAVWLFDQGFKTALLDGDKQRSSSQWIDQAEQGITIRTVDKPEACVVAARKLTHTHDFVVGDGPGGIDEISRALLLVSNLALLPITPSVLDLWSVQQATEVLRYAQEINEGPPEGRLILNKMRTRDIISREVIATAPELGVSVANVVLRDLQAYRDAAQQGTVVTRMGRKGAAASEEIQRLFAELVPQAKLVRGRKEAANG